MQLGFRGVPESCCSLQRGEFEGAKNGKAGVGQGGGGWLFGRMWPDLYCRPLAQYRSKIKHTHIQSESVPYGTILKSRDRKNDSKWNTKQIINLASFSFFCVKTLFYFLWIKLFLCLLSCLTTRLRMCTCMCRLPSHEKLLNHAKPLPLMPSYDHTVTMVTAVETSQPNLDVMVHQFAIYWRQHILNTTHPCGLAVSSALIGWRATGWGSPIWKGWAA